MGELLEEGAYDEPFERWATGDDMSPPQPLRTRPATTAQSVRVRDGRQLVTDGPFAETREQVGGFFMIEAGSIDEARSVAARIPSVRTGTIEVRPVVAQTAAAEHG